MQRTR